MAASVAAVEAWSVSVPLPDPIVLGSVVFRSRDLVAVEVRDDAGNSGTALGYTRGTPLLAAVELLAPAALGQPVDAPHETYYALRARFAPGWPSLIRAASLLDCALWGLASVAAEVPLWRLLSPSASPGAIAALAVFGYRAAGRGTASVIEEAQRRLTDGYRRLKLILPGENARSDIDLVAEVRANLPVEVSLAVDAHGSWTDAADPVALLGIITAAWLRLIPAPEKAVPVLAVYAQAADGCAAIEAVLGSGIQPAALEFLDAAALGAARSAFPFDLPADAAFMVVAEADGSATETAATAAELREALGAGALALWEFQLDRDITALWRWRDGVSIAVEAVRGGKVSEDIAVPLDRLAEAIDMTLAIGARHGMQACSWGHAGDGNLHSTFMIDPGDADQVARAHAAGVELYRAAAAMGGTISAEHGLGWLKRGHLDAQWNVPTRRLHNAIKQAFDPKNLMNPGKKT